MKPFWEITNSAKSTKVLLYGMIGRDWDGSGNDPKEFLEAWDAIPQGPIDLHIHSPGGYVFDGLAIYNTIASRKPDVTAYVDGLAASSASWIACAANKVVMPKTARMMIHDAQGFVIGDSETMREQAELLDNESDRVAQMYADKTGKSKEKMRDLMRATTWMDGIEAHEIGLADEVTDSTAQPNNFNLSRFKCVPGAGGGLSPAKTEKKNTNQPKPMDNPTNTAGPNPQPEIKPVNVIDHNAELERLRTALESERKIRITNQLHNIAATRPSIDVAKWLPDVLKNEGLLENLKAFPVVENQTPQPSGVVNIGNPLLNDLEKKPKGTRERYEFLRNHLPELHRLRGYDPMNVNTLSSTLVPAFLAEQFVQTAQVQLAPLAAFSRDFGLDRIRPRATVVVAKHTSGPTVQTNATNFESGDSKLDPISVTMNQYTASFHLDNAAQNQGFRMATLAEGATINLAKKISSIWTTLLATATYGAGTAIGAAASFDRDDLPAILALAKDWPRKNLVLDWGHLAYLLPKDVNYFGLTSGDIPGREGLKPYGFDMVVAQNDWTGAASNTVGVVCDPDAIAVASGLPVSFGSGSSIVTETATVEGLGLTVLACSWFSNASRTTWASYDVVFGAAAGDTNKLKILVRS